MNRGEYGGAFVAFRDVKSDVTTRIKRSKQPHPILKTSARADAEALADKGAPCPRSFMWRRESRITTATTSPYNFPTLPKFLFVNWIGPEMCFIFRLMALSVVSRRRNAPCVNIATLPLLVLSMRNSRISRDTGRRWALIVLIPATNVSAVIFLNLFPAVGGSPNYGCCSP